MCSLSPDILGSSAYKYTNMLWILFQGPGPGPMRHPILRIGCRVALLLLILICRAVYIFVEQPASSRLFLVPYYAFIQDMCGHFGIKFRNSFLSETELYVAAGSIFFARTVFHCASTDLIQTTAFFISPAGWVGWVHMGTSARSLHVGGALRWALNYFWLAG